VSQNYPASSCEVALITCNTGVYLRMAITNTLPDVNKYNGWESSPRTLVSSVCILMK